MALIQKEIDNVVGLYHDKVIRYDLQGEQYLLRFVKGEKGTILFSAQKKIDYVKEKDEYLVARWRCSDGHLEISNEKEVIEATAHVEIMGKRLWIWGSPQDLTKDEDVSYEISDQYYMKLNEWDRKIVQVGQRRFLLKEDLSYEDDDFTSIPFNCSTRANKTYPGIYEIESNTLTIKDGDEILISGTPKVVGRASLWTKKRNSSKNGV